MKNKKEVIEKLYFQDRRQLKDIAKEVGTSVSYVSKILRTNENYNNEKERRKSMKLVKRRARQKRLIYANRKNAIDLDYSILLKQHRDDTRELSKFSKLRDRELRKWCPNVYKYNKNKKRYEFDAGDSLKPADFPAYIKA